MYFKINRDFLLTNLLIVNKGLPKKTPLPILYGIKFEVNPDHIIMTASNSDLAIQVFLDDKSLNIKEIGNFLVRGDKLIDIIRKLESNIIEFQTSDSSLIIKTNRSKFDLILMESDDYPEIDFVEENQNTIELDSSVIKDIIDETNYATSKNEKRPILTGVRFKATEKKLLAVATDSYRLSEKRLQLRKKADFDFVIPSKSLDELSKILEISEDMVKLYVASNKVLFKINNITFQTRLLEGRYPDTESVIPNEFEVIIPFNKEELLKAVERVALLSPKDFDVNYNIINLTLRPDGICELTSRESEVGEALEEVYPVGEVKGSTINITFSSKYLIEALKTFKSPEIKISFAGQTKPFIIKGSVDIDMLHLILPVRIGN